MSTSTSDLFPPDHCRILIVDDQRSSAWALQRILEVRASLYDRLAVVTVQTTAHGAIDWLSTHAADVILLDLELLDGGDGADVLRYVREHGLPGRVIILTASSPDYPFDAVRLADVQSLSPDHLFPKPTPPVEIAAAVFGPGPDSTPVTPAPILEAIQ